MTAVLSPGKLPRPAHLTESAGSPGFALYKQDMKPTKVFDTYWRFAAERQAIFYRRLQGRSDRWTSDPILQNYRFTNAYRAADRVSQYLIREVQYGSGDHKTRRRVFFRTLLFKIFNRIETWDALECARRPHKLAEGVKPKKISLILSML